MSGFLSRTLFATVIFTLVSGCAAQLARPDYAALARSDPRRHHYVIGVADVVSVGVWKDPTLTAEGPVDPDGTLTVPLVGQVHVAGQTVEQVRQTVTARLAAYVKDPVVDVAVKEVNSYRFTVAGKVEHPGMFSPRYFVTVSEAIAMAGGPNRYASPSDIVVVRNEAGRPVRIPVDYDAILSGTDPEQDIAVLSGDTVLVP